MLRAQILRTLRASMDKNPAHLVCTPLDGPAARVTKAQLDAAPSATAIPVQEINCQIICVQERKGNESQCIHGEINHPIKRHQHLTGMQAQGHLLLARVNMLCCMHWDLHVCYLTLDSVNACNNRGSRTLVSHKNHWQCSLNQGTWYGPALPQGVLPEPAGRHRKLHCRG